MAEPLLSIRGLEVTFRGTGRPVPAVRGIDLDVAADEVLGIVGESGSGKSVTSLAMTGLLPSTAVVRGSIRIGGVEVTGADPEVLRQMRGRDVGMIFQDPTTSLNPVLPIGRQVTEGQVAHGLLRPAEASGRAVELLAEVDIPDPAGRALQFPHQFSGGMRQRAVIAMAMAGRPRLIIADEPTTALDVTVQAQVLTLLRRRQAATGAAVILITHDLGVIAETAHRVVVMYAGKIVEAAPVAEIFARPRHPYTVGLLKSLPRLDQDTRRLVSIQGQPPTPGAIPSGCAFHPRCPIGAARERCRSEEPRLRAAGPEGIAACHFTDEIEGLLAPPPEAGGSASAPRAAPAEPLLVVDSLKVHFPIRRGLLRRQTGLVRAVDGVSLEVRAGETLGLVGESGCGKTTTGRAIMGLIEASGGSIDFAGQDITQLDAAGLRAVRRHVQYVFQDPYASLNPIRTVEAIVAEPLHIHGVFDAMGGNARVGWLLDLVGLSRTMTGRYPRELSGGQRQRVGIARALAQAPELLLADEPTSSLDPKTSVEIMELM
ncbi:MAG: ABC transporter ATP-binding protein, partial [Geminicoccaceae bacterium]|nr:ABC transporter ATP-binding protein [Geminicoccaceae bacterium]